MYRLLDITVAFLSLLALSIPMLVISAAVKLTSKGSVLYWSDRIGKNNVIIKMPKFRTMIVDAPAIGTHLMKDPDRYITPIGKFLRKSSLDELPQLWCVLTGDMSIVGPRPALFNQDDLISLRTQKGIHGLTPGLTGWAQINGRDELPIDTKVQYDEYYMLNRSLLFNIKIIMLTLWRVVRREGVRH
jgi:O-antigen biosynthesis protein WbqP